MTPADERLAEALALLRIHGEAAAQAHVAERVGAMVLAGDHTGLARWKMIAAAMDGYLRERRQ